MWPHYRDMHARIGRERGWGPLTRQQYELTAGPEGALFVGSPETVATKIARSARTLGADRFALKYSPGTPSHAKLMRSIQLSGTTGPPLVPAAMAQRSEKRRVGE